MVRRVFNYDYGRQSLTPASYPRHIFSNFSPGNNFGLESFRVISISCCGYCRSIECLKSPSHRCRNGPIPFVIGPVSGGLPWTRGFPNWTTNDARTGSGFCVPLPDSLLSRDLPLPRPPQLLPAPHIPTRSWQGIAKGSFSCRQRCGRSLLFEGLATDRHRWKTQVDFCGTPSSLSGVRHRSSVPRSFCERGSALHGSR